MWINNDVLDYTNWKPGSQSGDCVEIRADTGQWSTNSCMRYKSYICKTPKGEYMCVKDQIDLIKWYISG